MVSSKADIKWFPVKQMSHGFYHKPIAHGFHYEADLTWFPVCQISHDLQTSLIHMVYSIAHITWFRV